MESIIKRFFEVYFRNEGSDIREFENTPEEKEHHRTLEELVSSFSKEQKDLFEAFSNAESEFMFLLYERIYKDAFQTGFWLADELAAFKKK